MRSEIEIPESTESQRVLFGPRDVHLRMLRTEFGVKMTPRDSRLILDGDEGEVKRATHIIERLVQAVEEGRSSIGDELALLIELSAEESESPQRDYIYTERQKIHARSDNQKKYIISMRENNLVFGIGPAGTGKTYLAVAAAVEALRHGMVKRLVLTRPAVEAGEKLGFLPGDMREKVDPYLRPIYDALGAMLSRRQLAHYIESGIVEVAPLAFMRGRTLEKCFVILDEAQNTTVGQMKMLLTRLGYGSRGVVTGDITQIDLPYGHQSGLVHATNILQDISGVSICRLTGKDIVRHPLVQSIVKAYDKDAQQQRGDVLPAEDDN